MKSQNIFKTFVTLLGVVINTVATPYDHFDDIGPSKTSSDHLLYKLQEKVPGNLLKMKEVKNRQNIKTDISDAYHRETWNEEIKGIPNINFNDSRRHAVDLTFSITRPDTKQKSSFPADCLNDNRSLTNALRTYPNNCYGKKKNNKLSEIFFINWWFYYGPDISYTFDFILWSQNRLTNFNDFWNLILYLKTLAAFIDNPVDVLKLQLYEQYSTMSEGILAEILTSLTNYARKSEDMEQIINQITESVTRFHNDKLILIHQLNEIMASLATYDTNQHVVENKVKDIGQQTSAVRSIIDDVAKKSLKIFYAAGLDHTLPKGEPGHPVHTILVQPSIQNIKSITFPSNALNVKYNAGINKYELPINFKIFGR